MMNARCETRRHSSFPFIVQHREPERISDGYHWLAIAIPLPPLGVFLQVGLGVHFWINILLTLIGYIPGIIHAVWVIARKPQLA